MTDISLARVTAASLLVAAFWTQAAAAQKLEALWYVRGEESIQTFLAHADKISIVAPQVFEMDSGGVIRGGVDARVVATARARHVKLVPLVMNPGFDQPAFHRVLTDSVARRAYARPAGGTAPGPVAGYPWMLACLKYVLSLGVPPSKISLGLAGYSDWWYPTYDSVAGARQRGSDIAYRRGMEILSRA